MLSGKSFIDIQFKVFALIIVFLLSVLKFNRIPLYGVFILTFGGALVFALLVRFLFVPWLRKKIGDEASQSEEPMVEYSPSADGEEKKVAEILTPKKESDKSESVINFHDDSGIYIYLIFLIC